MKSCCKCSLLKVENEHLRKRVILHKQSFRQAAEFANELYSLCKETQVDYISHLKSIKSQ